MGVMFFIGYGREIYQHDWTLTLHQHKEALEWPVGYLCVMVPGLVVLEIWKRRKRK